MDVNIHIHICVCTCLRDPVEIEEDAVAHGQERERGEAGRGIGGQEAGEGQGPEEEVACLCVWWCGVCKYSVWGSWDGFGLTKHRRFVWGGLRTWIPRVAKEKRTRGLEGRRMSEAISVVVCDKSDGLC